jgi:hypothetical protein
MKAQLALEVVKPLSEFINNKTQSTARRLWELGKELGLLSRGKVSGMNINYIELDYETIFWVDRNGLEVITSVNNLEL